MPPARPEPSQDDICHNIAFQARQLDSLIHSIKGSSFGPTNQLLEVLLENLLAFFFPRVASMVSAMDHVLLYTPSVPKKYGGTGPDPLPALHIIPLHAPEAPAPPAPVALPPTPQPCSRAALLSQAPPTPPRPSAPTFAEACTKQGTKATIALLRPSAASPPSNTSAIHDFVATRPLGDLLPLSQAVTLCGDWALTFKEPLTFPDLQRLQAAVDNFHHPGSEVVNRPTSTSIKFPHMPTVRPDRSAVSDEDLLNALHSHPRWQDVSFVSNPCFIQPSGHSSDLSALVHCEPAPSSSPLSISSGLIVTLKHGSLIEPLHSALPAAAGVTLPMSAGPANRGALPALIESINCSGPHSATSRQCPFFTHHFNALALAELQKAWLHQIKEAQASKAASKPARPSKGKSKA
ncbi:hypothetical protein AX15_004463 [Amanita polypyramis BW_CC]|nr:hypothetical protein AX15_004463 [Amanita polypyramis BW_CC]